MTARMEQGILAAVDLGSNSFRLQIARVVDDQIYLLDSLKETVRLAAGLSADKWLDDTAQARALEALSRFGERLRDLPRDAVRVVGTNTLRAAKNSLAFLEKAEHVLGFPIEVIAGREEARLIYLGVAHSLPATRDHRLVVDIGGGSTEFIIGSGLEPQLTESLYMGCVSYSLRFFPDGRIDKQTLKHARLAALNEVQAISLDFIRAGWTEAVGSSGTARVLAAILEQNGWGGQGITREGLGRLKAALLKAGQIDRLDLAGLPADRAQVLPGGFAIMEAIFEELGLERMQYVDGALREGVLYDLLGRFHHEDMREVTVRQFQRRYHVDMAQARRVCHLAEQLFRQLVPEQDGQGGLLHLQWAARLHEIGISIAHVGYHKHSAYMIQNADMPGFSRVEQERLGRIVLAHRGKLAKVRGAITDPVDWAMVFSLRIAALLCRSRRPESLPEVHCQADASGFTLWLPALWLKAHPMTAAALQKEISEWRGLGFSFQVRMERPSATG